MPATLDLASAAGDRVPRVHSEQTQRQAAAPPRGLSVTTEPIESLEAVWTALLERSRTQNVFVTWSWLATWWQHFRRERQLRCYVVRDNGEPIAIVPLCIESRRVRIGQVRVLRNVGYGDVVNPDFLDALVVAGREQQVADAIAPQLISARDWDFAEFGELDPQGSLLALAQRWHDRHRFEQRVDQRSICPYIPLPKTFDAFLAARNSHFRQQLRRYRRVIERELKVEWRRVGVDISVDEGIAHLTRLHQERMEATERGGNFKKGDYQAFHRDLALRLAEHGALFFWVLFSGGESIATHYGYLHDRTYYGYQMGFTHKHARFSPGHYMTGVVIEKLIALGATEMNLLRGTDGWKFRWTDVTRQTVNVTLLRPGWGSRLAEWRAALALTPPLLLRRLIGRESFEELRRALANPGGSKPEEHE